jgi:hypothetical protein
MAIDSTVIPTTSFWGQPPMYLRSATFAEPTVWSANSKRLIALSQAGVCVAIVFDYAVSVATRDPFDCVKSVRRPCGVTQNVGA